jgi:DNA-binding transcriptional MerR regulator
MSANSRKRYMVKGLAELSGVSVRTLRFYDEIGLFKPSYYGENGYRYYENDQLFILQQILFYRELGIELTQIQKIMSDPKFDKVKALQAHREVLEKENQRTQNLIDTIDKTLAHLQEEAPMADSEIYKGFDEEKQAEYEEYLIENYGDQARHNIDESKKRTKDWKKEDFEKVGRDYAEIHRAIRIEMEKGISTTDPIVQKKIKDHYAVVSRFWTPKREEYIALGQNYCNYPEFRKVFDSHHPKLAEFIAAAMKVFADQNL